MRIKQLFIASFCTTMVCMLMLFGCSTQGMRPMRDLKAEEIVSADISLYPPDTTFTLTDSKNITELVGILRDITLYNQDDAGRETAGQLVEVTLALQDGSTATIGAYGDYMYYNDVCYQAEYAPSERLHAFGNSLYNAFAGVRLGRVKERIKLC